MADPTLTLVRHGETEWSRDGRHTSHTDLPLLMEGRAQAERLTSVIEPAAFTLVLSSPRLRARQTAELAGFTDGTETDRDLVEWDYGEYEGLTSPQIRERDPDWQLWRDGCPGGESPVAVAARADRVIARASRAAGPVLLFAHGHLLRMLLLRWIDAPWELGARLDLSPASVSRLGLDRGIRVLETWNAVR